MKAFWVEDCDTWWKRALIVACVALIVFNVVAAL
jgi:hypothetical protein